MKTLKVLAILSILCFVKCKTLRDDHVLVAGAINGILQEYFEPRESKVDFFYYGVKGGPSEQIVERILRSKSNDIPVKVSRLSTNDVKMNRLSISSVHIFDSKQQFIDTRESIEWLSDPRRRYEQLVYVPNLTTSEIITSPQDGLLFININFLILDPASSDIVSLASSLMFEPYFCRVPVVTVINRFSRKSMKWENKEFFPKQFKNFNGCPIIFDKEVFQEVITHLFADALSTHLNITVYSSEYSPGGFMDVLFFWDDVNHFVLEKFVNSVVIYSTNLVFIIPPGEPYSQFEKMFLMFQDDVWIAIGVTFIITLAIIQVLRFMSVKVQNFVFGNNIRTPTLNFIEIFLNGGQNRDPETNIARSILMLFVVWSLVIRTCYQSKFFELLQIDLRKPRFETIDQLIENNFTIYYCRGDENGFVSSEIINQFRFQVEIVNCSSIIPGSSLVAEPSSKVTFPVFSMIYRIFMKRELSSGSPSMHMLSENVRTNLGSLIFEKFSPYYERFNELIDRMFATGITKRIFHIRDYINRVLRNQEDEIGPQILSMDHLGLGFLITLIFLGLCFVVFVLELVISRINCWFKRN